MKDKNQPRNTSATPVTNPSGMRAQGTYQFHGIFIQIFNFMNFILFLNFRYRHFRNVHEGIKDHDCEYCGKSFTSYGVLKNHVKTIHSDSKDFVCDICTKAFAEKGQLKAHINIVHKGIKNYKCNFW